MTSAARVVRVRAGEAAEAGGLMLSQVNVPGIAHCLGVARIAPGEVSPDAVRHVCGEVMYVAAGQGELRTDGGPIPFRVGDALHIPPGLWHWLANTGTTELVSVFSFPTPNRPDTESRPVSN